METAKKRIRRTKKQIEEARLLEAKSNTVIDNPKNKKKEKKEKITKNSKIKNVETDVITVLDIFDVDFEKADINVKQYKYGAILYVTSGVKESSPFFKRFKLFLTTIGYVSNQIDMYYAVNNKQTSLSATDSFNIWFYTNNKFTVRTLTILIKKFIKQYNSVNK